MKRFFKPKQEPESLLLYQQYKRDIKEKEIHPEEKLNTKSEHTTKRKIPKLVLPKPVVMIDTSIPKKKKVVLPYSVAICSLSKGCGSTYMTAALEHYIRQLKRSVFVRTNQENIGHGKEYEHLIYHFGNVQELDSSAWNEVMLCEKKIMMCLASDDYFTKLAEFMDQKIESTQSWCFFFNFVTERWKGKIEDIMEDYMAAIVPTFDIEDGKAMEELVKKVW